MRLVEALKKLPGVGPKSAQRMAYHLLQVSNGEVEELREALRQAKAELRQCQSCFNMASQDPCEICSDLNRDTACLCVVADSRDLMAVERSGSYRGLYHILGGLLNPVEGMTADRLTISSLLSRIKRCQIREVILALNPVPEGEATIVYLTRALHELPVVVSRIGLGLPVGAEMEYADELTLQRAFEGRKNVVGVS